MMRKEFSGQEKRALTMSIIFVVLVLGVMVACMITPDLTFSENENRNLKQRPELSLNQVASGAFMKDFEKYAADSIIGRDYWVTLKSSADLAVGKKDNGSVYFGKKDYLFQMEELDGKQLSKNVSYLKLFFQKAKERNPDIRTSILPAPTSTDIMSDFLPSHAPVSNEEAAILAVEKALPEETCNVIKALSDHRKEYIYYRTDHHWTTLGAYYAYAKWASGQGIPVLPIDEYNIVNVSEDFLGTLDSKAGVKVPPDVIKRFDKKDMVDLRMTVFEKEKESVSNSLYDESYLKGKDKYSYFLGGNQPLAVIETGNQSGRSILVIKDSYSHCFIPFLTETFDQVVIMDPRYYKESALELVSSYQVTDLLVLYNIIGLSKDRNLVFLTKE